MPYRQPASAEPTNLAFLIRCEWICQMTDSPGSVLESPEPHAPEEWPKSMALSYLALGKQEAMDCLALLQTVVS